ncbi:MAG: PaaI family thioesterase [Odoribacter sp.]|nr:PaaI family thioesterase [Bacteroidales bacterium]MBR2980747.1 PaaI family thioesterase [Odoribacter sp.]
MNEEKKKELLQWYNTFSKDCYLENNGIVFTDFGEGWAEGTMPLDHRTCRHDGAMHGGANVAFAETLAGWLGIMSLPVEKSGDLFGVSITANHIHQAKGNLITGRAEFVHKGHSTQVIKVELRDTTGTLVTVCTVTNLIKST